MLMLILTWIGAVLGLSLLLIMALGPVIVEADSWWYARRHERRRLSAADGSAAEPSPGSRTGSSSTTAGSRPASGPRIALRSQPTHIS